MNQEQCACWPKNPNDIACKHYIAAIAYPMNQDNQVGWEAELKNYSDCKEHSMETSYHDFDGCCLELPWLKSLISRVAQDSYAEGIRRAMRVANSHVCGKDGHNCAYEIFAQLEKEVKK